MGNDSNIFEDEKDENKVGGYNYYIVSTVLNDAFRFEENTVVDGINVNAKAFYYILQSAQ